MSSLHENHSNKYLNKYSTSKHSNKSSIKNRFLPKAALLLVLTVLLQCFALPAGTLAASKSDLYATLNSTASLVLSWGDYQNDERGYLVERKVDSGNFETLKYLPANTTSLYDGNLSAGHYYTYRVKVKDADGYYYMYTNELTFRTDEIERPISLTVTPAEDLIEVKWAYTGNKTFNTIVEKKREGDKDWYVVAIVDKGQNVYEDYNVSSGEKYYYRVSACIDEYIRTVPYENDKSWSYISLEKPTDLRGFAISNHQIKLTWQDNSTETAFILERKSPDVGIFKEIAVIPKDIDTYIDSNLKENTLYSYRIKAVSGTTKSDYSDEVYIASTYLKTPGTLKASSLNGTGIILSWQDLTDTETGFEIWRKTGSKPTWELYETMGRNATTFTDTDVSTKDSYSYRIRAKINDNSVYSDFTNEVTIGTTTIPAPSDFTYEPVGTREVNLTWQDESIGESGFKVERKIGLTGEWRTIATLAPNTETYKDIGVNLKDTVSYRIKVYDDANALNYSNELTVSLIKPEAPSNLMVKSVSASEIEITWRDNSSNETEFIIEAKRFYNFIEVARVPANTTTYSHKNLPNASTVSFRVKAVNGVNQSNTSNEVQGTTIAKATYNDLSTVSWAVTAINELAGRGVFDAKPGSKLYPGQYITKGEYCAIIIRSLELGKVSAGSFADINSKHKYYKEVMSAAKLGIISPDKNNKIYPNNEITREEAAIIISLALKVKGTPLPEADSSILKQFADYKSISQSSADKIAAVCSAGIISGRDVQGKVNLQLSSRVNRAEAAVMVYKALSFKDN